MNKRTVRRRYLRQVRQDNQQLEVKAKAEGIVAGIFALLSVIECHKPQPDSLWCSLYRNIAEKKAQDFLSASVSYAIHTAVYR
jgi:hypothetical protein